MLVATHSGPFHADDVFAFALLRTFVDSSATIIRTRDLSRLTDADVVIDVGGEFDPGRGRFDHHQASYQGALSSAGMVLNWLEEYGHVKPGMAERLRREWVDHIDAVDTGRTTPDPTLPSFGAMVSAMTEVGHDDSTMDQAYLTAVSMAEAVLGGLLAAEHKTEVARHAVGAAMAEAEAKGHRVIRLDGRYKWKRVYFEHGGAAHPTDFVLFPDNDGARLMAIPPTEDSFAQKRPLPAPWAGLTDAALSRVVGVAGARFCHKNRFIAVFNSVAAAEQAIECWNLDQPEANP